MHPFPLLLQWNTSTARFKASQMCGAPQALKSCMLLQLATFTESQLGVDSSLEWKTDSVNRWLCVCVSVWVCILLGTFRLDVALGKCNVMLENGLWMKVLWQNDQSQVKNDKLQFDPQFSGIVSSYQRVKVCLRQHYRIQDLALSEFMLLFGLLFFFHEVGSVYTCWHKIKCMWGERQDHLSSLHW